MKLYLSSYKLGNKVDHLKEMAASTGNNKVAFIPNAMDGILIGEELIQGNERTLNVLKEQGFDAEIVDLKDYFDKPDLLAEKMEEFGMIWVRGGNVFVLRQAMKLSGFDELIHKYNNMHRNIVYAGDSAGICVLAPSLRGLEKVDPTNINPYPEYTKTIWEGLGILDYVILPHYQSDHHESALIEEVFDYMKEERISFKTLRDGEVIIEE